MNCNTTSAHNRPTPILNTWQDIVLLKRLFWLFSRHSFGVLESCILVSSETKVLVWQPICCCFIEVLCFILQTLTFVMRSQVSLPSDDPFMWMMLQLHYTVDLHIPIPVPTKSSCRCMAVISYLISLRVYFQISLTSDSLLNSSSRQITS